MAKWLFFDIGYTLIDETAMWERRYRETAEMANKIGKNVTPDDVKAIVMDCAKKSIPIAPTTAKILGLSDMAKYQGETEVLFDDAESTLVALKNKGYKLGVIANQPENLDGRLKKLGIFQYFDVVVSSHDCGVVKPNEKIFLLALSRANCNASEAVMVGDRVDNDIVPAKKLGMQTVRVLQGICATQQTDANSEPTYSINKVSELLSIF